MIVQSDLLNKLKAFGLNTYESKLWMALLSRGVSTAGELSDIANVPRSRSYDVLESLEKKGFIMMKIGKPIKYVAVKPSEVLDRVKKKIESDAQTQTMMIDKIKESEVLEELRMLHSKGIQTVDPGELTGSIKGRNNIYNHMSSAVKNATKSVVIMGTDEDIVRMADSLKKAFNRAKRNDIPVKIAAPINEISKDAASQISDSVELKHADKIKARFMIVDDNEVTFMLTDDKKVHPSYDVAVWASSDFFCQTLISLFDNTWDSLPAYEEIKEDQTQKAHAKAFQ